MKTGPDAWDDTKLPDYPGKDIILARRENNEWYLGGIMLKYWKRKRHLHSTSWRKMLNTN